MYNKLFTKILYSSIWNEDVYVRCLWLTFLAAQDIDGYIACATMDNLARLANLPLDETKRALHVLMSPDLESTNPDNEGRRIEQVAGGFNVLNHAYYKNMRTREQEREMSRIRSANYRARKRNHENSDVALPSVTHASRPVSVSVSDSVSIKRKKLNKESVCEELGKNEAYKGIDIAREFGKMEAWCMVNHKEVTERRFVNWLNRVDRPIQAQKKPHVPGDIIPNSNGDDYWAQLSEQDKKGLIHGK